MSPPIRDGSGNDIGAIRLGDGSEITEVRTGAGDVLFSAAVPDSVTDRPNDAGSFSQSQSRGLVLLANDDYDEWAVRISRNSSGFGRMRVYDYSIGSYVENIDISGKSGGDTQILSTSVKQGNEYGVEIDNNGSSFTLGLASNQKNYPYTGTPFDITAVSDDGVKDTSTIVEGINDVGDPDDVL